MIRLARLSVCLVLAACHHADGPAPAISNSPDSSTSKSGDPAAAPPKEVGHVIVMRRTPVGGVLQLRGDRPKAMEEASKLMAAHCGAAAYTITREGEEAIDGDAKHTEWLVSYECTHQAP